MNRNRRIYIDRERTTFSALVALGLTESMATRTLNRGWFTAPALNPVRSDRVYMDPLRTLPEALAGIGLTRTTSWRARQRGWFDVEPAQKRQARPVEKEFFDVDAAYGIAYSVYRRYFAAWWPHQEDLIQEAVAKCYRLSLKSMDRAFQWTVARNAIRDYVSRLKWPRETLAMDLVEAAEESLPMDEEKELLAWLRGLAGETVYDAALDGDRDAIETVKSLFLEKEYENVV